MMFPSAKKNNGWYKIVGTRPLNCKDYIALNLSSFPHITMPVQAGHQFLIPDPVATILIAAHAGIHWAYDIFYQ